MNTHAMVTHRHVHTEQEVGFYTPMRTVMDVKKKAVQKSQR